MGTTTKTLRRCPDCQVPPGERHKNFCDVSQCPACGWQALQCDEHRGAGQSRWTGGWPGDAECREFGYWARWTVITEYSPNGLPDSGPFVECPPDHPHARTDLNRLALEAARGTVVWDRERERYVKPTDGA